MKTYRKTLWLTALAVAVLIMFGTVGITVAGMPSIGLANLPGSGWYSGHQVQNTGTTTATVAMTAYNQAGTSFSCGTQSLGPSKSYTFQAATDCASVGSNFQGSAVVAADQPIVAVVNVTNKPSGGLGVTGGEATGTYQGVGGSDTNAKLSFPLYKNAFGSPTKTTTFFVQNAGAATANITATFNTGGVLFTFNYNNVPVNAMVVVNPSDASVPASTFGSLTVVGSQPLAGSVLEAESAPAGAAKVLQATRGNVPSDGDSKAFAPIIKRKFGGTLNDTGLQVQNVTGGGLTIAVQVNYTIVASPNPARIGTVVSEASVNVADGASANFPGATSPVLQNGELASATIQTSTPSGKLVGLVSERTNSGPLRNTTYSTIPSNKTTIKISLPLAKEQFNNKRTGIQVQNVGASPTTLRVTYFPTDGSGPYVATTNNQIAAGSSRTFLNVCTVAGTTASNISWGGTGMIPCGKNNGVLVDSLDAQKIVAIANESIVPGGPLSQDSSNYEGFNIQ